MEEDVMTFEELDKELNIKLSQLGKTGRSKFIEYQDSISDSYDFTEENQVLKYYQRLINKVNDLLDDNYGKEYGNY